MAVSQCRVPRLKVQVTKLTPVWRKYMHDSLFRNPVSYITRYNDLFPLLYRYGNNVTRLRR